MPRAHQHHRQSSSLFVLAVAATIAFLLLFSILLASSAGPGFYHIALDLPVFFLLLFLAACTNDWLEAEDTLFLTRPSESTPPTRAPPASFF
jgi:hypothetical protein